MGGVLIGGLYAPNGNPQPGPKFDYKLAWNERLIARAAELVALGEPVVLAGDYNIIPTPTALDVYKPERWADDALMQPEPQAQYRRLAGAGLDRRAPPSPPGRAGLHLLGLLAERLRPQRRHPHRPSAAQPGGGEAAEGGRGGPGGEGAGKGQRPRPDLGRAEVAPVIARRERRGNPAGSESTRLLRFGRVTSCPRRPDASPSFTLSLPPGRKRGFPPLARLLLLTGHAEEGVKTFRHQDPLRSLGDHLRARRRRGRPAACSISTNIPALGGWCSSPPAPAPSSWPAPSSSTPPGGPATAARACKGSLPGRRLIVTPA